MSLASWLGHTESLEMNDLVAVHDAERDAGNVHRLHLRGDIGVNRLKIGGLHLEPAQNVVQDGTSHTSKRSLCWCHRAATNACARACSTIFSMAPTAASGWSNSMLCPLLSANNC